MESQQVQKSVERQTAVKVWIRNLTNGQYILNPGWEPNQVLAGDLKISRANLIGVVVQMSDSKVLNYDYVIMDDGTGSIMVRAFENREVLKNFKIGDIVNMIGKPREYGGEIYLIPEIAKRIDNQLWIDVRKKELENMPLLEEKQNTAATEEFKTEVEEVETEDIVTPLDKIINTIKELDSGDGVDIDSVVNKVKEKNAEKLLQDLMIRGDIFEIRPGRIKVLE